MLGSNVVFRADDPFDQAADPDSQNTANTNVNAKSWKEFKDICINLRVKWQFVFKLANETYSHWEFWFSFVNIVKININ